MQRENPIHHEEKKQEPIVKPQPLRMPDEITSHKENKSSFLHVERVIPLKYSSMHNIPKSIPYKRVFPDTMVEK